MASALNYVFIDSGAMYRAVTLYLMQNEVDVDDESAVEVALANVVVGFLNSGACLRHAAGAARIEGLAWMGDETKAKALVKLAPARAGAERAKTSEGSRFKPIQLLSSTGPRYSSR